MTDKNRCKWCNVNNPAYVHYHDEEWGVLNTSDAHLFEMLILESFQAGLSWECVLNKRESFRLAYDGFDLDKVASYGDEKISELTLNAGLIRNKRKICASVNNAVIFKSIKEEFGSFYSYLTQFTNGEIYYETGLTTSPLAVAISNDLIRRKMKFVGSTIIYSFLQAVGIIHSHDEDCFLHKKG